MSKRCPEGKCADRSEAIMEVVAWRVKKIFQRTLRLPWLAWQPALYVE